MSLSTVGKGIKGGLSFLGGGSAAKGAVGVGGAVLDAFAGSGKQGGKKTEEEEVVTSQQDTTQTQAGTVERQESEIPELSAFRQNLLPQFQQELDVARSPVFGPEAQAAFVGQVNDTTNRAFDSINQRLAARGAGASGQLTGDTTDLELARGGQISDFFSSLPFRERQARLEATTPLLSAGLSFAGRGPGGVTETADQTTTGATIGQVNTNGQTNEAVQGPGFGKSLAGVLGGAAGKALGGEFGDVFGEKKERFDETQITSGAPTAPDPTPAIGGQAPVLDFRIFPQTSAIRTPSTSFINRR